MQNKQAFKELQRIFGKEIVEDTGDGLYRIDFGGYAEPWAEDKLTRPATSIIAEMKYDLNKRLEVNAIFQPDEKEARGSHDLVMLYVAEDLEHRLLVTILAREYEAGHFDHLTGGNVGKALREAKKEEEARKKSMEILLGAFNDLGPHMKWEIEEDYCGTLCYVTLRKTKNAYQIAYKISEELDINFHDRTFPTEDHDFVRIPVDLVEPEHEELLCQRNLASLLVPAPRQSFAPTQRDW